MIGSKERVRNLCGSHVLVYLFEVLVIHTVSEAVVHVVIEECLTLALVDSLQHLLQFVPFLRIHKLRCCIELLLQDWVCTNRQLRLVLDCLTWNKTQTNARLLKVRVIVPNLFAHRLLRNLVNVLVIAHVDSSMNKK